MRRSKLQGPTMLTECTLKHSEWCGSVMDCLQLKQVEFSGVLNLEDAHFTRLETRRISYGADLEVYSTGATFENGATLGQDH